MSPQAFPRLLQLVALEAELLERLHTHQLSGPHRVRTAWMPQKTTCVFEQSEQLKQNQSVLPQSICSWLNQKPQLRIRP